MHGEKDDDGECSQHTGSHIEVEVGALSLNFERERDSGREANAGTSILHRLAPVARKGPAFERFVQCRNTRATFVESGTPVGLFEVLGIGKGEHCPQDILKDSSL